MTSKITNYYVGGNTAKGFHSFLENNLVQLEKVIFLKGSQNQLKSKLMKTVGNKWSDNGLNIEYIHDSTNNGLIEGVINQDLKIAVIDGSSRHIYNANNISATKDYFNLDVAIDKQKLHPYLNEILEKKYKIENYYKGAYKNFFTALKIHDEWEKIYISNMNYKKADNFADELIQKLLGDRRLDKSATVKDRFFGAATPEGPIDFIENLTSSVTKRYLIKGRPGTGKSTLLKKLVKAASDKGFDVEVYHCGFDPNSLDMVLLKELDLCVFDSTSPHEYFPSRENDEIIDMYEEIIKKGTDENFENEIEDIVSRYNIAINKGTSYLKEVKLLNDELQEIYTKAIDDKKIKQITNEFISRF